MTVRNRLGPLLVAFVALALSLNGCDDRRERAQDALNQYQAALASGDLQAAKRALGMLVTADDTNADYWIELARVSLELQDFTAAYNAFVRAHELDRANVEVLSALTQLALRSGNLSLAEEHARELGIVSPDDTAVSLTMGYVALRKNNLDEARTHVEKVLSASPYDPNGKILRARLHLAEGEPDQAIALLQEQVRLQPSDALSLGALASIYELREQWADAAASGRKLLGWRPQDHGVRARLIEYELRAGQSEAALATTTGGLAKATPAQIAQLLTPWLAVGRQKMIADRIFAFGQSAPTEQKVAAARFLFMAGEPQRVIDLLGGGAEAEITAANASTHALLGAALAQVGKPQEGLRRLDAVLTFDERNVDALRGRAEARSRMGAHRQAIEDAQKVVAADRSSPFAHLLLARIHVSSGDSDGARRSLWNAFHDLPGERIIFEALMPLVQRADGTEAARRLSQEFNDQRNEEMIRSIA